jgi:hypothetical protein
VSGRYTRQTLTDRPTGYLESITANIVDDIGELTGDLLVSLGSHFSFILVLNNDLVTNLNGNLLQLLFLDLNLPYEELVRDNDIK